MSEMAEPEEKEPVPRNVCPKCGNVLYIIDDADGEISYLRVYLECEGALDKTCDFKEVREVDISDIREHGMLQED